MSVVLLAILGWLTRDRWMDFVDDAGSDSAVISTSTEGVWQPLTAQGAERGRRALEVLQQPEGPSAVVLTPSDLGAYVYRELARQLPPSADSVEATTLGDQLHVRASVRLRELGGRDVLGPLAALLGERERLRIGGTLRVVRPGLGELTVREIHVGQLRLPSGVIPRLVRQISRGERPPGLSDAGLPLRLPPYVGEVRVAGGNVTIGKAVQ